jgi:hypothetical protein
MDTAKNEIHIFCASGRDKTLAAERFLFLRPNIEKKTKFEKKKHVFENSTKESNLKNAIDAY